jgi:glycosyltransferase involved in cell wall biosynthesis
MIVDVRSPPVEISGFNGWLHTFCFDAAILIAKHLLDGLTIITSMMRREICSGFHIDPRTVGVWTSGVSTDFFYPAPLDSARAKTLREEMGLTGKFVILYHGVLTSKRGVFEAAASLKLLDARYRQIVLLILGKGPAHTAIVEASRKEIEEGRIIFHDPVDYEQIPHYISMCDIGIVPLPDIPEWRCQCPLNLLECLSMGKVVVATNIPANREVAGESKCVIYAANAEPREFAKAIAYAFDNRNMLHTWGAYCRTIVEKRYAWTQVARNLDRYLSTLGQSHVPKITLA